MSAAPDTRSVRTKSAHTTAHSGERTVTEYDPPPSDDERRTIGPVTSGAQYVRPSEPTRDALSRARVPSATCAKGTDDGTTSRASCRHARDSSASPDADTKGADMRCSPRGVSHRSAPATHT